MHELASALAQQAWPRALALAVDAWRAHRTTALADLVDAIGARCAPPAPRSRKLQAWWVERALAYDPVTATTLAAHAWTENKGRGAVWPEVVKRWGADNPVVRTVNDFMSAKQTWPYHANPLDRLAGLFTWPDDPRTGIALATCIVRGVLPRWGRFDVALQQLSVQKMVELLDARALRFLADGLPDRSEESLATRARIEADKIDELVADELSDDDARRIDGWLAEVRALPPPIDIEALWREVSAHPRDLAPRLVLADALVQTGDPRGELIALQCGRVVDARDTPPGKPDRAQRKIARLLQDEWVRWLGDIALVVTRRSEFANGMLEVAAVGQPSTPAWAWQRAVDHRELAVLHTILPVHAEPAAYATFVVAYLRARPGQIRHLGIDTFHVVDLLRREMHHVRRELTSLGLVSLEYSQANPFRQPPGEPPPLHTTFDSLAQIARDLALIDFTKYYDPAQLARVLPHLRALFPALRTVRVTADQAARMRTFDRGLVENLAELEIVPPS